jgi:aminopeptidase N
MSGSDAPAIPSMSGLHEVRRLFALNNHLGGAPVAGSADISSATVSATGGQPQPVYRADYKAPDYLIPTVELHFALGVGVEHTIVTGSLSCERVGAAGAPLVLDGEGLNMLKLTVNGAPVDKSMYTITSQTNASTTLTILGAALPADAAFTVETTVEIFPEANHQVWVYVHF